MLFRQLKSMRRYWCLDRVAQTMPTQKITVEGLQLNVSIRGQGSPLLLLNGLGGLIRTFDPLRDELVDFRTITLDVPGVGKSQMPRWPMRLPRHADLIAEMTAVPSAPADADSHRRTRPPGASVQRAILRRTIRRAELHSCSGPMHAAIGSAEVPAMHTYRASANPPSKPVGRRRSAGSANRGRQCVAAPAAEPVPG